MPRRVTRRMLQDFVEGRLGSDDEALVLNHLKGDPALRTQTMRLRKQAELLRRYGRALTEDSVPGYLRDLTAESLPGSSQSAPSPAKPSRSKRRPN